MRFHLMEYFRNTSFLMKTRLTTVHWILTLILNLIALNSQWAIYFNNSSLSPSLTWLNSLPRLCVSTIFGLWWLDLGRLVTSWVPFGICLSVENWPLDNLLENICSCQKSPKFTKDSCDLVASLPSSRVQNYEAHFSVHHIFTLGFISAIRLLFYLTVASGLFVSQNVKNLTGKEKYSLSLYWKVRADLPKTGFSHSGLGKTPMQTTYSWEFKTNQHRAEICVAV